MTINIRPLNSQDFTAFDQINRGLPDWFGIEEGLEEARGYLHSHSGLVAEQNGTITGYLTWEQHFDASAEISWMAVSADSHRQGIGRALAIHLIDHLQQNGTRLLTVKTLADTHPSTEYAQTRAFYASCGFLPQMVLPDLWDPSNPCLVMVRVIAP